MYRSESFSGQLLAQLRYHFAVFSGPIPKISRLLCIMRHNPPAIVATVLLLLSGNFGLGIKVKTWSLAIFHVFFCHFLLTFTFSDVLSYGKMSIYGNLSGWPDTYFTEESNRSVIRQFNPIANCSRVLIFGFASSFIPSWTVDFWTPDMMESCRTDKFLSYIIWDNRIFISILSPMCTKIWKEVYQNYGIF